MNFNISKQVIRIAVVIVSIMIAAQVGLVYVTQVALAQSTLPPRPTPTGSDQSTPVRNTPIPINTPILTPMRSTPTLIDTPASNETPIRPTPTSFNVPPPSRATPTVHSKPQSNPPEPTLAVTPNVLPVSGAANRDDGRGPGLLLVLAGLGIVCWEIVVSIHRWRQRRHN